MSQELVQVGPIVKRRPAGQQAIERGAETVHIRAHVHRPGVRDLLGGHVVGGAHRRAHGRQPVRLGRIHRAAVAGPLDQPPIDDDHARHSLAVTGQHQVGRLHVSMHQAALVGCLQPQRRLPITPQASTTGSWRPFDVRRLSGAPLGIP